MCDPLTVALAVGSTILKTVAENKAVRSQERATEAAIIRQGQQDQRAQDAVRNAVQIFENPQRQAATQQIEQDLTRGFEGDLERVREEGSGQLGRAAQGRTSEAFELARAGEFRDKVEQAAKLAQLLGKVRAPARLREAESFALGDVNQDLGVIRRNAAGDAGVDRLAIERAGRVNPLLIATADLLSGAGRGLAGRAPASRALSFPDPASAEMSANFGGVGPVRVPPLR